MRVVFDANVLISFLLTRGPTISKIFKSWQDQEFTLLVTDEILLEIKQVLERFVAAKLIQSQAATALLRRLEEESEIITSFSKITISPDKKDNRYLACAKDGKAKYLVTGDKKHLLNLRNFGQTEIISPVEFVEISKKKEFDRWA